MTVPAVDGAARRGHPEKESPLEWGIHERICLAAAISFMALVLVILLTVWIVLMLESGGHPSRTTQEAAKTGDEPGEATAPERESEQAGRV
jgi:hypothetical protein